jgi:lysozyme family protein
MYTSPDQGCQGCQDQLQLRQENLHEVSKEPQRGNEKKSRKKEIQHQSHIYHLQIGLLSVADACGNFHADGGKRAGRGRRKRKFRRGAVLITTSYSEDIMCRRWLS